MICLRSVSNCQTGGVEDSELKDDNFDKEPPKTPKTRTGDIYVLGDHRLICGDCTDENVVRDLMRGDVADVTITSPPYGASDSARIRTHYERGAETYDSFYESHDDKIDTWAELIRGSFKNMRMASQAQFVNIQMLADNKRDLISWIDENKNCFCDVIVWDKKTAPPQMHDRVLNNQFEFVFVFADEGATRVIPYSDFHGSISNIIELTVGNNEYADVHRAVFPVKFPAEVLKICSTAESVFDPFGGTGTTMIACEQLGRKCYMCELDPAYCDLIVERWETFTGKKAVILDEENRMGGKDKDPV